MLANGIVTFGLGGDNTTLILGINHLGFQIIVEEILPGGTGAAGRIVPEDKKEIRITIKHHGNVLTKIYLRDKNESSIVIKILKISVSITTSIMIKIGNIRKILSKIVVKRK